MLVFIFGMLMLGLGFYLFLGFIVWCVDLCRGGRDLPAALNVSDDPTSRPLRLFD